MSGNATGRVIVFTGEGKGKTTAALGLGLRALGQGLKVCVIQFIKARKDTGEVGMALRLGVDFEIFPMGAGFVTKPGGSEKDRALAAEALELAWEKMRACDVLVLDEINCAIKAGLIRVHDVLSLIEHRPAGVHLVLTGRGAPAELVSVADTVTEMMNIKHAGEGGARAEKGIEY